MAENSKIEWCHHTFNPWRGCTKVSAGCDHCYAERDSKRFPAIRGVWGKYGTRVIASEAMWREPVKWNKKAAELGERHRVFCASLADVFEGPETMPDASWEAVSQARERLGQLIDDTPNLDWLLLTKRPENVLKYGPLGHRWTMEGMPKNVWLGTSVEDQKTADERIPLLLKIPATVRFLSMEPLLGPVDLSMIYRDICDQEHNIPVLFSNIDWVIAGGESGPQARPMHPDWVRSLRDQCIDAVVPFHFKQWGEWVDEMHPVADSQKHRVSDIFTKPTDDGHDYYGFYMMKVGKRAAGRLLDGRTWDEFPEVSNGIR